MHCYACDKMLSENEINYIPETKKFDCCAECLEIAMDAAYSNGFVRDDPLDDPELQDEFGNGDVQIIDSDWGDSSDIVGIVGYAGQDE